jgi:hypothetical protein
LTWKKRITGSPSASVYNPVSSRQIAAGLCSRVLAGFSAMKLRRLSVLVAFAVAGAA